jgi:acyl-CoA synthetase (NDP forming)
VIDRLLGSRSFALIGASDRSAFSSLLHRNLVAAGHGDRTFLVNPRSSRVHDRTTTPSCVAIGQRVDLAYVMVPAAAAPDALRDAAAAGAGAAVVLSSGYAEAGAEGRARQVELVTVARELDIALLGPNALGFVDVAAGVHAMALADPPTEPGPVALISQSGASCGAMKDFAALAGVALSHVVTVGNEAMITIGHLLDHLVDDDRVRAVAIFVEGFRDPELFASAARRAAAAGKAVVVLKAGRSELAARSAASHTGALVGDDRVVDAVLGRLGVIRVDTIEDMVVTAGIAAYTGSLARPGLGVVSISGGACDMVADLAQQEGAELPGLDVATTQALGDRMPDFGQAQNPLDITGAAITDPSLWTDAITAVAADPSVGAVLAVNSLPWRDDGRPFHGQRYVDAIGEGVGKAEVPVLYATQVTQPVGAQARGVLAAGGVPHVVPGLRLAVAGLARVARWSGRRAGAVRTVPRTPVREVEPRPLSEVDARALLTEAGVPVVPGRHARSAEEAAEAAAELGGPVAMKVVSAQIAHKSDIGGVRLDVAPADAAAAYDAIVAACGRGAPGARLDGVLLSPMRPVATELLVGGTRDPQWGLMLAVGLGGVLVEVLDDVVLSPLPVDPAMTLAMLERLRGAALLEGARGRQPADLARLAEVLAAIGRLAESLGDALQSLEVNPLRVAGHEIEALDALVVWKEAR